jgi:hypothetical protein
MALPVNSQFGFKKETTWGTAVTVDKFFEYESESLALNQDYYDGVGLRADTTFEPSTRSKKLKRSAAGDMTMSMPYKNLGAIIDQMVTGTVTPVVVNGTGFKSTFNVGLGAAPTKSATLQVNKPRSDSTDVAVTYPGAMITAAGFSFATGSVPMLNTSWVAKDETTPTTTPAGAALASASYPANDNIWTDLEIAVSVNSVTATRVTSVNLNWQMPRAADRRFLDTSPTFGQPVVNGRASLEGTIEAEWDDTTVAYYDLFRAGTFVPIVITVAGTTVISGSTAFPTMVYTMTNAQLRGTSPTVGGPDLIGLSIPFAVKYDGTNAPLKIEVTETATAAW